VRAGTIFKRFTAKDGRTVILRTPKWEDLDDLVEFINSLVEEGADIALSQKVSRGEEAEWLGKRLVLLDRDEELSLVAEVDGKVVANSEITRRAGYSRHVGGLGIAIKNGYRDVGIGTEMLKTLVSQAEAMGLTMLTLTVFSANRRAVHVYEKVGFEETGRIPNAIHKDGKFMDEIIMVKNIT